MKPYTSRLRSCLSPTECTIFAKHNTPQKIQNYLDTLEINFDTKGYHVVHSPRLSLVRQKAHCLEGALLGAAMLAYHGHTPLLLDLRSTKHDYDHVLALFKFEGYWGALSKTNHSVLRYRDPVYKTLRELVMTYFHEYFLFQTKHVGQKTLRSYSKPFNLEKYRPEDWITKESDLEELAEDLDASPHIPVIPNTKIKLLRNASKLEIKATKLSDWDGDW